MTLFRKDRNAISDGREPEPEKGLGRESEQQPRVSIGQNQRPLPLAAFKLLNASDLAMQRDQPAWQVNPALTHTIGEAHVGAWLNQLLWLFSRDYRTAIRAVMEIGECGRSEAMYELGKRILEIVREKKTSSSASDGEKALDLPQT